MALAVYRSPWWWQTTRQLVQIAIAGGIVAIAISALVLKDSPTTKTLMLLGFYGAGFTASIWRIIQGAPKTGLPPTK
jgi:hypothetical protein